MKLLLEGNLNESLRIKDLLIAIYQAEAPGLSVLKLAHPSNEEKGELYFLGGRYIVRANLEDKTSDSGLTALNHLLHLTESYFSYYACESLELMPQGDELKI